MNEAERNEELIASACSVPFLDFGELARAMPKDVIKKISIHDIKRICDNFNQQRNGINRNQA